MIFETIARYHPVIHAITNPVTMTDVVNAILASGASAICADNEKEAAEITGLCQGLLLNTGMPEDQKLDAMLRAGKAANEKGIPVILDPVGAGSSSCRKEFIRTLLDNVHFSCIRCNMSEAAALSGITFESHGVEDAGVRLSEEQMTALAAAHDTLLAITGETDYAVSADAVLQSRTGTPLLKRITGAGCMLSGLTAAALAAGMLSTGSLAAGMLSAGTLPGPGGGDPPSILSISSSDSSGQASALSGSVPSQAASDNVPSAPGASLSIVHQLLQDYGLCAEQAVREMNISGHRGTATFQTYLIDTISRNAGIC